MYSQHIYWRHISHFAPKVPLTCKTLPYSGVKPLMFSYSLRQTFAGNAAPKEEYLPFCLKAQALAKPQR
jgi:hypothetical protein